MEKNIFISIFIIILIIFIYRKVRVNKKRKSMKYLEEFKFPLTIRNKVKDLYPHLNNSQLNKVEQGLKEWFYVCYFAKGRAVSMPSQVVDVAWHELILFTKLYHDFCNSVYGKFLHHNPAEAMASKKNAQTGIKTAWKISCLRESITPNKPRKLPILFSLDAKLKIPDGFYYALNCNGPKSNGYCATHIGCSSVSSCSSCSSSDGDSSSGCGGGCGGD